jgi:secreted PhoX family phosphatase
MNTVNQTELNPLELIDPDDREDNNPSTAPHLKDLVAERISRRDVIKSGVGAMAVAGFSSVALTAADEAQAQTRGTRGAAPGPMLDFQAVPPTVNDFVTVPPGYTATVIYATGDRISPVVPEYAGDGSEDRYDLRAGDHHDGMEWFGLSPLADVPDRTSSTRGLLAINHENITGTAQFLHPQGETNLASSAGPRPESEVIKEIDAHGISIVEFRKEGDQMVRQVGSRYNRRITGRTVHDIAGPVRGTNYVKTKYSPQGLTVRGSLNHCGHGVTPWGTYLGCEENWAGYFIRGNDAALRSQRENTQLLRNGIRPNTAGFAHRRWASVVPAEPTSTEFSRFNCTVTGASPTDDFRNEPNAFGYIVEVDPYDPLSRPKKRTALGRRANEGAWSSNPKAGRPLAFYIGCDSRNEYVYKYVTAENWNPLDARRGGMAAGDKYLDRGTIYAAVFNADGTGRWEPLVMSNPKIQAGVPVSAQNPGGYQFEDLADICVNTRLAAGACGATRMDRPEWTAVNPTTGEIYITMTENPDRGRTQAVSGNNVPNPPLDAANPRAWRGTKGATSQGPAEPNQQGNVHGHIVRIREDGDDAAALTFRWDIFLFGAQANADNPADEILYQANVNLSGLTAANELSKPDGCWFSRVTGILYIQTDDNTMTDRSNAMMLAALPGRYGDGAPVDIVNQPNGINNPAVTEPVTVRSYAGKRMSEATLKRMVVAPFGAEITGLAETPDGKALFINIQHPGENTGRSGAVPPSVALTPATLNGPFESNWPGNVGYGPGGANARPRSTTVMITRNDGGVIGWDPSKRMA